jgi:hypothetical protein
MGQKGLKRIAENDAEVCKLLRIKEKEVSSKWQNTQTPNNSPKEKENARNEERALRLRT